MYEKTEPRETVYWLHLELASEGDPRSHWIMSPEQKAEFLKLAKAEEGISRDILVPGDMNLHALHYAILRLFGWQNSHLHRYMLPDEAFNRLTTGRAGGYMSLCGALFRGEYGDETDAFWDDDYQESMRFETWLRHKYSRPFEDLGLCDTWFEVRSFIAWLKEKYPNLQDEETIADAGDGRFSFYVSRDLLESLCLEEIFTADHCTQWANSAVCAWKQDVAVQMGEISQARRALDRDEDPDSPISFSRFAEFLKRARGSIDALEAGIAQDASQKKRTYHKQVRQQTGRTAEKLLEEYREQERFLTEQCEPLFTGLRVRPTPFTDTLLYQYDFGDNWWIKISVQEVYRTQDDDPDRDGFLPYFFRDSCGMPADDVLQDQLCEVLLEGKSICTASDGINLIDDVGGIDGYIEFLRTLKSGTKEEKAQLREWARIFGWTGRRKKPENML